MALYHTADELLGQLKDIIDQLQEGDFAMPVPVLNGSTLGQHMRHSIEFFLCLIDGRNEGIINYDQRKHDPFIEQDPKLASSVIASIRTYLRGHPGDFQLDLEANYSLTEEASITMPSSFYRELAYNIEHTIHHMALLKIAITNDFSYVKLPDHFGVASSTVRHQHQKQH